MTHPWWWYLPIVGYLIVAERCRRTQQAVKDYHDRGEAAPRDVMEANRAAFQATYPAINYTLGWLVAAVLLCLLAVVGRFAG